MRIPFIASPRPTPTNTKTQLKAPFRIKQFDCLKGFLQVALLHNPLITKEVNFMGNTQIYQCLPMDGIHTKPWKGPLLSVMPSIGVTFSDC